MFVVFRFIKKKIIIFKIFLKVFLVFIKNNQFYKKKNLFIDLGTNEGQAFNFFKFFFSLKYFDYILVEPNPYLKQTILSAIKKEKYFRKITFINKAAYVKNTKVKLYGLIEDSRGKKSDGASILDFHNSKFYRSNDKNSAVVDAFCFINFLKNLKMYDNIIIKFDIEGSEYDVLEKMILNHKKINNVKHMFIEFHTKYMMDCNLKKGFLIREKKIITSLKKISSHTLWI
jgi:FkbM family methyltransferase